MGCRCWWLLDAFCALVHDRYFVPVPIFRSSAGACKQPNTIYFTEHFLILIAFAHRRWSFSSFLLRWREPGSNLPWANIPCAEWDIILGRLVHDSKSCVSAKKDVKDSGCACFLSRPEMGVDGQVVVYLHVVCMSCNVALECRIHREFLPILLAVPVHGQGSADHFQVSVQMVSRAICTTRMIGWQGQMVSNALGNWVWKTTPFSSYPKSLANWAWQITYFSFYISKILPPN